MCYDCGAYYLDLRFDSLDVTNVQRIMGKGYLDISSSTIFVLKNFMRDLYFYNSFSHPIKGCVLIVLCK